MPNVNPTGGGKPKKNPPKNPPKTVSISGGGGGGRSGGGRSSSGSSSGGGSGTPQWFARRVLTGLGLPRTRANINWMVAWESREGGHWENTAQYNPLNTTLNMPGSGTMNGVGVRVYSSWKQGIDATVQTLADGRYADIRQALATGKIGMGDHFASLMAWSGGGYDNVSGGTANYHPSGSGVSGGNYPGGGGGSQDLGTPQPLSVKQYLDNPDIQQNYGYLSAFLHNKQIGPILAEAAKKGWGVNQLLGALSQTKWWKNTAASARSWQAQQKLDPATAQQRLGQMTRQVQVLARSTLGFALDPDRASRIANTAIAANWSQAELQHAVGAEFHYHQAQAAYGGAAGQTLSQFKQMSQQYLVPMSNHTLGKWTRQVLEGTYQPQDFQSYLQAQAKSLYPTLSSALDKGMTVADYLNPYAQLAAQTLEISPDSIDWFHPKWAKALNTTTPDGQRAPMSLSDWGSYLRSLPDYQKTQGARDQAASLALNIAQTFGKVSV